ncbi:hypothetical protein PAPYR_12641 [Paratrimastix pyriformis]|uniref:Uncharacterized protein n=1 Tax=Paratrimastix pyriformis TaxID=342808 RepID=A0ABQ8U410_9EUKA|nr:hypothetical protein PAPYR_12641 [Paratrimastix pyriformis]
MECVTECLVTKDEREVIAVVLFSWPIGPTTPDGSVPGTVPPGDNIARTRLPKPKIVSVLNSHVGSSVARASMLKGRVPHFGHAHRGLVAGFFARIGDCLLLCKM